MILWWTNTYAAIRLDLNKIADNNEQVERLKNKYIELDVMNKITGKRINIMDNNLILVMDKTYPILDKIEYPYPNVEEIFEIHKKKALDIAIGKEIPDTKYNNIYSLSVRNMKVLSSMFNENIPIHCLTTYKNISYVVPMLEDNDDIYLEIVMSNYELKEHSNIYKVINAYSQINTESQNN